MASSGWQGRQDLYTVNAWLKYRGDINIQGITRSGTSLRVWGQLALCCVAGSSGGGGSQTVNYGIQATVNGSGGKVKTSASAPSYAKTFNEGTNYVIGFDTTFTNVSESASTYTVTATYKSCYNDACSSTYWSKSLNWTLTLPTNPTGLYANNLSSTYNSVSGTVGVSSYGGGSLQSVSMLVLEQSYVAGLPHRYSNHTGSLSFSTTVNNSSPCANAGCITIKGAGLYYIGVFADNGDTQSRLAAGSIYTPPSPLQSITYTQTQNSTNVTVNLTITGGTSSDNNSNTVTTYYRYSTNGGSSYSGWTSAGTGTPWTAKTASFTCPYNASIVVQAKQTYQSKDSTTKQISFTSTSGTAPSSLTSSITASTWNSVTMSGSCNYGNPSSISGRAFTVGVNINGSSLANRREKNTQNVTSMSGVVINNSSSNLGGDFTLKGMLPVYPYAWASNTVRESSAIGSVYYLPPAPGSLTYTTTTSGTDIICALNYVGVAANNDTGYTAADLTRTVRYKGSQDANWTYVENDTQVALTTATTASVTIAATHNVTVEAWMTYKGKNSDVSTITVTNSNDPVMLYGSVNGRSKKITKLYGSVGGESVKIEKLYASVGGVSRLIYVDNS